MPTKQRRYLLKTKEAKQIIENATKTLKFDFEMAFDSKTIMEIVESDVGEIYLISGKPVLFKAAEKVLPTLLFSEFSTKAPKIVVDMGAIPYVCKGATVMAPGIVRVEGNFRKEENVVIADMKHGKALAIGEALMDSETARQTKKGPVAKNMHYVGDKVWDYIKTLSE
jgi:PUA-domain protein